MIPQTTRA